MFSWLRHRARSGTIAWLLTVCLTAVSGATPLLAAAGTAVDSAHRHHALPSDDPPAAPVGATAAAIDDLSGPEAAAVYRLSSPAVRYHGAPPTHTPRLQAHSHERPAERGPPARLH